MNKKNKRKIIFTLAVILIISTVSVIKAKQVRPAKEVAREVTPTIGDIHTFISTTGTVQPQNRLEIKPPISGRIEEIKVSEGEKVKVGQILAWMSSTERAALLDSARSQGQESLAYWQEVYNPAPLIAPIDGEVIVRAVEPGQTVTSSDAVIVLSDRLIVKAEVDETDIGKVKIGQVAIISLDAYPQVKVKAKVDHISYESNIVNNVTIYEVDVLPEEVPDVFRSGMSANVDIIDKNKEAVLLLPLGAIKQDGKDSFVLLSQGKGKKTVRRKVELGIFDENNIEVTSGLEPTDKVIMKTQEYTPSRNNNLGGSPLMPFGGRKR